MSNEPLLRLDIVGRLKIEGCESLDNAEIDRCVASSVAPACCKAHIERAIEHGYTYADYTRDAGL